MRLAKKIEIELENARRENNVSRYIEVNTERFTVSPFERYRRELVSTVLAGKPLGLVIDVGCNIGMLVKSYEQYAHNIVLCDNDSFMLEGAKIINSSILPKLQFMCADVSLLPFRSNFFDTVIVFEVLEHLPKDMHRKALEEIVRVVKKGGEIFISTPNRFSLAGLEGRLIECFSKKYKWNAWDPAHKYIYSSWEIIAFMKKFDVKIKKVIGSYFLPGSLLVRLPVGIQKIFGAVSHFLAKYAGSFFPFKYVGFTIVLKCNK